jgi:hypothetical protein
VRRGPKRCKICRHAFLIITGERGGIFVCLACDFLGEATRIPHPDRARQQEP